jgi:hypothetical protein
MEWGRMEEIIANEIAEHCRPSALQDGGHAEAFRIASKCVYAIKSELCDNPKLADLYEGIDLIQEPDSVRDDE